MISQRIDPEEEFANPNINFDVMMAKLKKRILDLESDVVNAQDYEVKAFAENKAIELREKYFGHLETDMKLQHMVLSSPEIYKEGENDEDVL